MPPPFTQGRLLNGGFRATSEPVSATPTHMLRICVNSFTQGRLISWELCALLRREQAPALQCCRRFAFRRHSRREPPPAFSLEAQAQRKSYKKETPKGAFALSGVRQGLRALDRATFKKVDETFGRQCASSEPVRRRQHTCFAHVSIPLQRLTKTFG